MTKSRAHAIVRPDAVVEWVAAAEVPDSGRWLTDAAECGKCPGGGGEGAWLMMEALVEGARQLGLGLTPEQLERFEVYYRELVDWNRRANLTAIVDYREVQLKHFLDSLTVLLVAGDGAGPSPGATLADVGSGAGFPGLPLKIVRPDLHVTLIESIGKKTAFLHHIVETLGLSGVEVVTGRAEDLGHDPGYRETYDLSLARAVAALPALAELNLPFCRVGGTFVAQKKRDIAAELKAATRAFSVLGGRLREVRPVDLPGLLEGRSLVVVDKVAPTPRAYPRRAGLPAKHPL